MMFDECELELIWATFQQLTQTFHLIQNLVHLFVQPLVIPVWVFPRNLNLEQGLNQCLVQKVNHQQLHLYILGQFLVFCCRLCTLYYLENIQGIFLHHSSAQIFGVFLCHSEYSTCFQKYENT